MKRRFRLGLATSCGLVESARVNTETQNYMEPYVEETLPDEEWLQKYRKKRQKKEDEEGLARELNQRPPE